MRLQHVEAGRARLDKVVRDAQPAVSWGIVRRAIRTGKVRVDDAIVREPGEMVREGQRVAIAMAAPREPKLSLAADAMPRVRALAMPHRAAITTSLSAIRLNGRSHFFGREQSASGPTAHRQP